MKNPIRLNRAGRKWLAIPLVLIALGVLVAGVLAVGVQPTKAQNGGLQGVILEPLTGRSTFPDDVQSQFRVKLQDGSHTQVSNVKDPNHAFFAKVTFDPGGSADWHYHPGPVIVVVAEGSIKKTEADDCHEHIYSANQAFVELGGGNAHRVENIADVHTVLYHVFLEAPAEGPPITFVDPPTC